MVHSKRYQTTISKPASVSGFGFWSGNDVTIEFRPAAENTGVVFIRTDLPNSPRIPAVIQNRVPGPRRTTLVHDGCAVELVEHVMAALAGLKIDNCEVHVDRAEMPGLDGSSIKFVEALDAAGRVTQTSFKSVLTVLAPIRVEDGDAWIEAQPLGLNDAAGSLKLTYLLDYDQATIGKQSYSVEVSPEQFATQIASARTFLLQTEAEQLRRQGLGTRVQYSDVLVFGDHGLIDSELRFPNECARHKALDVIGDFALLGKDLIGQVTASKSGHRLNSKMVFALLQQGSVIQERTSSSSIPPAVMSSISIDTNQKTA